MQAKAFPVVWRLTVSRNTRANWFSFSNMNIFFPDSLIKVKKVFSFNFIPREFFFVRSFAKKRNNLTYNIK